MKDADRAFPFPGPGAGKGRESKTLVPQLLQQEGFH